MTAAMEQLCCLALALKVELTVLSLWLVLCQQENLIYQLYWENLKQKLRTESWIVIWIDNIIGNVLSCVQPGRDLIKYL